MPSTHSATSTHYAVFVLLACHYLPIHSSLPQAPFVRLVPPLVIVPWAFIVIQSRIWLGHHTWAQCAVGCLVGASFSLGWFTLWTHGVDRLGLAVENIIKYPVHREL